MATHKTFSNIYLDADYADVEIRCGSHVFYAHRAAVCARSKVLGLEIKTGFSAGGKVIIDHSTFEAQILDCVLQFVYQNGYTTPAAAGDSKDTDASLATHVHVHAFADMYDIIDLKSLAAQNFVTVADHVKDLSTAQMVELIASIYAQTTGSEDILRAKVLKMAFADKEKLAQDADFVNALTTRTEIREFATSFIGGLPSEYKKASAVQRTVHAEVVDRIESALEKAETGLDISRTEAARAKEEVSTLKDEAQRLQSVRQRLDDAVQLLQRQVRSRRDLQAAMAAELFDARALASEAQRELAAAEALAEKRRIQLLRAFSQEFATRRLAFWETFDRCRYKNCAKEPFEYFERIENDRWVAQCNSCRTRHYYPGV